MIFMKQPSLVINSHDVPGPTYKMFETWKAPKGVTAIDVVNKIYDASINAYLKKGSSLQNVIINSHGYPGGLSVGGRGNTIKVGDLTTFAILRRYADSGHTVGTIWIVACNAAKGSDGKTFCSMLAMMSGCKVVAADKSQYVEFFGSGLVKFGLGIDEYEGNVFLFYPTGAYELCDPHGIETAGLK